MSLLSIWFEEDHNQAIMQGWCLTEIDDPEHGPVEIQKYDEAGIFKSDDEAFALVFERAFNDIYPNVYFRALVELRHHNNDYLVEMIAEYSRNYLKEHTMSNDIPKQTVNKSMLEVDVNAPTVITCTQKFDHKKGVYFVQLSAVQDELTIEDTEEIKFYDFMTAKIYIDKFYEKYSHATH